MKRSTLGWIILTIVSLVRGEFFILSGPEYQVNKNSNVKQMAKEMYCITDELGSALSWNDNLGWKGYSDPGPNKVEKTQGIYLYELFT